MKVVYIAGSGRSGSTLLDLLLGQASGTVSVGELRQIWKLGFMEETACSCGEAFQRCPFWSEVLKEAFGRISMKDVREIITIQKLLEKIPWGRHSGLEDFWRRHQEKFDYYRDLLSALYQAIGRISGAEFVIDSSKWPTYLKAFHEMAEVSVFVIHLVRDSRAVAFSWQRRKFDPARRKHMKTHHPFTAARMWLILNLAVHRMIRYYAFPYFRLRYEDLMRNPISTHEKLTNFLPGLGLPHISETGECISLTKSSHLVGGNPMKMEVNRRLFLRLDEEWREKMSWRDRWLVAFVTWPLLFRYGYL